jgi:hypothetical protein
MGRLVWGLVDTKLENRRLIVTLLKSVCGPSGVYILVQ